MLNHKKLPSVPLTAAAGQQAPSRLHSDSAASKNRIPEHVRFARVRNGFVRRVLRQLPVVPAMYAQARLIAEVSLEWANPERANDRYHRRRDYDFESLIERGRHARTLAAVSEWLGPGDWGDVLEVGCSEGMFTGDLALRCTSVTAYDISGIACARATQRCVGYANVRIEQGDICTHPISRIYDVVFALDIFDCVHGVNRSSRLAGKLADATRPGGLLVVSLCDLPPALKHAWWAQWLLQGRDQRLETLHSHSDLRLVHYEPYPDRDRNVPGYLEHVIALFEKTGTPQAQNSNPSAILARYNQCCRPEVQSRDFQHHHSYAP
jgi:SAM-dependent methyltransferase